MSSVAVQCAVAAQTALAETNASVALDRRISFRIGIHVGDVMVRAGDLFGDDVNIAARGSTTARRLWCPLTAERRTNMGHLGRGALRAFPAPSR